MARIRLDEKQFNIAKTYFAVKSNSLGISEREIVIELNFERKTVNNYLHYLAKENIIYKCGLFWFCDGETPKRLENLTFLRVL